MPANSTSFTSTVSAITDAFGDPTRRGIYLLARESASGVTASQVAEEFGVHPNVARHHLDKLAAGGYLEVAVLPVLARRLRRREPQRHAGLRTLARD